VRQQVCAGRGHFGRRPHLIGPWHHYGLTAGCLHTTPTPVRTPLGACTTTSRIRTCCEDARSGVEPAPVRAAAVDAASHGKMEAGGTWRTDCNSTQYGDDCTHHACRAPHQPTWEVWECGSRSAQAVGPMDGDPGSSMTLIEVNAACSVIETYINILQSNRSASRMAHPHASMLSTEIFR
jgi:hypothetical protein